LVRDKRNQYGWQAMCYLMLRENITYGKGVKYTRQANKASKVIKLAKREFGRKRAKNIKKTLNLFMLT